MFLLFIDESGRPESSHPEKEFALGALLIHESLVSALHSSLDDIRSCSGLDGACEFHASDIVGRRRDFKNHSLSQRLGILESLIMAITRSGATPMAVVLEKTQEWLSQEEVELAAFGALMELAVASIADQASLNGRETTCIVFIDSSDAGCNARYRKHIRSLRESIIIELIESPIFLDSRHHDSMQMADIIAYLSRRSCRKDSPETSSYFRKQMDELYHGEAGMIFVRKKNGGKKA